MAKARRTMGEVPKEVHDFLSRNGRKGGATTRRLIQIGKAYAEKQGLDVQTEVRDRIGRKRRAA